MQGRYRRYRRRRHGEHTAAAPRTNLSTGRRSWATGKKHAEAAVSIDPKNIKAHEFLGYILMDGLDQPAQAETFLAKAVAMLEEKARTDLPGDKEAMSAYPDIMNHLARARHMRAEKEGKGNAKQAEQGASGGGGKQSGPRVQGPNPPPTSDTPASDILTVSTSATRITSRQQPARNPTIPVHPRSHYPTHHQTAATFATPSGSGSKKAQLDQRAQVRS